MFPARPLAIALAAAAFAACSAGNEGPGPAVHAGGSALTSLDCVLSQGYWKTHEDKWPLSSMAWGAQTYSEAQLLDLMKTPVKGDASIQLAYQLIAAHLNVAALSSSAAAGKAVLDKIAEGDGWMATHGGGKRLPYGIDTGSVEGAKATSIATSLESFNTGGAGLPHCGDLPPGDGGTDGGTGTDGGASDGGVHDGGDGGADGGTTDGGTGGDKGCTSLGAAAGFDVFVISDFVGKYSDVEGAVAAGGNVNVESYSFGASLPTDGTVIATALIAGGNLDFKNGQCNGDAWIYGTYSHSSATVVGAIHLVTPAEGLFPFAAAIQAVKDASASLAALKANGSATAGSGGQLVLSSEASPSVFAITAAQLKAATAVTIGVPAGASVLINVSGAVAAFPSASLEGGPPESRVLFHFPAATTITIENVGVPGSILAPLAAVKTASSVVRGSIFAASYDGTGQTNHRPFRGCLKAP